MENANRKLRKLAVLDELAEMGKRVLLGVGNKLDEIKHALYHGTLELVAAFIAQDPAEELQHARLFAGELEAKGPNCLNNGDLELVRDFRHEARDLLHQTIHTGFVASLEQRCDGESGDGAVAVGNEEFNVRVANANRLGLERSEVVKDTESGKLGDGTRRREEELEDVDCLGNLGVRNIPHVADSLGRLEVYHFALMPQPAIQQLHHGFPKVGVLLGKLGGETNKHDNSSRVLDRTRRTKLLDHLDQGHPVVHAHLIKEADGVVLGHGRVVGRDIA